MKNENLPIEKNIQDVKKQLADLEKKKDLLTSLLKVLEGKQQ